MQDSCPPDCAAGSSTLGGGFAGDGAAGNSGGHGGADGVGGASGSSGHGYDGVGGQGGQANKAPVAVWFQGDSLVISQFGAGQNQANTEGGAGGGGYGGGGSGGGENANNSTYENGGGGGGSFATKSTQPFELPGGLKQGAGSLGFFFMPTDVTDPPQPARSSP